MNKNTAAAAAVGAVVALAATYAMNSSVFATRVDAPPMDAPVAVAVPRDTAPESRGDSAVTASAEPAATVPAASGERARPRFVVPMGTTIPAIIETHVSSRTARRGDLVIATTTEDISAAGRVVIPAGATVQGEVDDVRPASETRSSAILRVIFTRIGDHKVRMALVSPDLSSRSDRANSAADVGLIAGGAITGAVIGHQIDGDKGKERGAVVGGVAGILTAANTGANVQLKENERAVLRLSEDLEIR